VRRSPRRVRRVAPDAPAPIVEEESSIDGPGGAGLAAVFAAGEGFDVQRYGTGESSGAALQGLPGCPHRRPTSITEQIC